MPGDPPPGGVWQPPRSARLSFGAPQWPLGAVWDAPYHVRAGVHRMSQACRSRLHRWHGTAAIHHFETAIDLQQSSEHRFRVFTDIVEQTADELDRTLFRGALPPPVAEWFAERAMAIVRSPHGSAPVDDLIRHLLVIASRSGSEDAEISLRVSAIVLQGKELWGTAAMYLSAAIVEHDDPGFGERALVAVGKAGKIDRTALDGFARRTVERAERAARIPSPSLCHRAFLDAQRTDDRMAMRRLAALVLRSAAAHGSPEDLGHETRWLLGHTPLGATDRALVLVDVAGWAALRAGHFDDAATAVLQALDEFAKALPSDDDATFERLRIADAPAWGRVRIAGWLVDHFDVKAGDGAGLAADVGGALFSSRAYVVARRAQRPAGDRPTVILAALHDNLQAAAIATLVTHDRIADGLALRDEWLAPGWLSASARRALEGALRALTDEPSGVWSEAAAELDAALEANTHARRSLERLAPH